MMMMALPSLVTAVLASVLYVLVLRKAGFTGGWYVLAAGPIVAQFAFGLFFMLFGFSGATALIYILPAILNFAIAALPLFVLAFKEWPIHSTKITDDGIWK